MLRSYNAQDSPPATRNYLAPNVTSAEVEKLDFRLIAKKVRKRSTGLHNRQHALRGRWSGCLSSVMSAAGGNVDANFVGML